MVEYFNNVTLQLVDDFHTESNNIRDLLNAVPGKKKATTPQIISPQLNTASIS